MKLKVYDLDNFFESQNVRPFHYNKVAIFEGKNGVVVAEAEAVHKLTNLVSDSVKLQFTDIPEPGKLFILPQYEAAIPISELKKAPVIEMGLDEFFDRQDYNSRCRGNYAILMASLKEIGFDISPYMEQNVNVSLEEKISSADQRKFSQSDGQQKYNAQEKNADVPER